MRLKYAVSPAFEALGIRNSVVAEMYDLSVVPTRNDLVLEKEASAARILEISEEDIASDSVLESYRSLVRSIGRSPKRFPPAAEKLLRQVRRTGHYPTINAAVDAYNLVVARTGLALGVHDLDQLDHRITFRTSAGGEEFTPVGGDKPKLIQSGDYVYADEQRVLAWLDSSDVDVRTRRRLDWALAGTTSWAVWSPQRPPKPAPRKSCSP